MRLKNQFFKSLIFVLIIIVLLYCTIFFQENAPIILERIKGLGWLAPFLFMVIYCLATILLLPTMVLTLAGGALFGPMLGTLFNLIGATLGALCAFCISRYFAGSLLGVNKNPRLKKLISGVERRGWQFVALLRLIPIIPFNFVNYGLGITRIKFAHYAITTFIFLAPGEIIYTYCGHAGMDALIHPAPIYKNLSLIIILGISLFWLVLKLFNYYRNRHSSDVYNNSGEEY